jgi:conjugal transfer pilus assembly protein TraW
MQRRQAKKSAYTAHKILVFASRSLGKQGLEDVLAAVSGNPEAVVVFRGIPKGMKLGQGVKFIQALAAEEDPLPNIIIDPTLFRAYKVSLVPTIVMLEDEPAPGEQSQELARVAGLSDPAWLIREIESGERGDLGMKGPVEAISEPDLIEVAKSRLAKIKWDKKKREAIKRFWEKQPFNELPAAQENRTRELDPSILITRDITAPNGALIAKKGAVINPLDIRDFTQAVVVFDPLDKKQIATLAKALPDIRKAPGVQRITYIATRFDRDKGWDSYKEITDHFDTPVYLLTPDLVSRFELEVTPSIITAKDKKFIVRELAVEGDA